MSFFNKANGWVVVAAGAYLLAIRETWDLIQLLEWPIWIFWVLIVILPIAAIANAVTRLWHTRRVIDPAPKESAPERKPEPDGS